MTRRSVLTDLCLACAGVCLLLLVISGTVWSQYLAPPACVDGAGLPPGSNGNPAANLWRCSGNQDDSGVCNNSADAKRCDSGQAACVCKTGHNPAGQTWCYCTNQ